MNKIKVRQKEIILQDEEIILEEFLQKLDLKIKGHVYCGINNFNNQELNIYLEQNSNLTIEFFLNTTNTTNKINIYNEDSSTINLHYSCTYKGDNELIIDSLIKSSNNNNNILIRTVENEGNLVVKAMGKIEENTFNNNYLEDIKAITNTNNRITIWPDLLVKSDSVKAIHNATISPISKEELFYLESKGINYDSAISLIKNGFLKGILEKLGR